MRFLFSAQLSGWLWSYPPPIQWHPGYFPGTKRPGREVIAEAEIKNE
jgi:hypothetical protein